jgi:pimeloyl-ACP methyl ester carboxylesterase
MRKQRLIALLSATALFTGIIVSIPVAANAAPACDGKSPIQSCVGVTSDGAPYMMMVPANFGGTVALYSHGYRYNIDIPAGIPLIGGYKVTNTPEPIPNGNSDVAQYLFSQGIAVVGSGFARQGWNPDSAIATNVELIGVFKAQFPKTTKVIAWGSSLGAVITQGLAEKHPELVSAAAPMCLADNVEPQLTGAGDFLWGVKTLFDPTIKGGNYSAGAAGNAEALGDLVKIFTVMAKVQASLSTNAWPDTSSATGKALAAGGVPPRSALLLLGLMAGIPTQSAHFDSISGPAGALKLTFPLALSPALAILENGTTAAVLAVLATQDVELQAGGAIFDNTKTDYAARVENERVVFNAALSGNTAIDAMLGALSSANPGAPRAVGVQLLLQR